MIPTGPLRDDDSTHQLETLGRIPYSSGGRPNCSLPLLLAAGEIGIANAIGIGIETGSHLLKSASRPKGFNCRLTVEQLQSRRLKPGHLCLEFV